MPSHLSPGILTLPPLPPTIPRASHQTRARPTPALRLRASSAPTQTWPGCRRSSTPSECAFPLRSCRIYVHSFATWSQRRLLIRLRAHSDERGQRRAVRRCCRCARRGARPGADASRGSGGADARRRGAAAATGGAGRVSPRARVQCFRPAARRRPAQCASPPVVASRFTAWVLSKPPVRSSAAT